MLLATTTNCYMSIYCCVQLGLRTLCIARRRLNSEEFDHLDQLLKNARTAMDDRDAKVGCVVSSIIGRIYHAGV